MWSYPPVALAHLSQILALNDAALAREVTHLTAAVARGEKLWIFGSGHSSILGMELFHRAGAPAFVLPVVWEGLLPTSGPTFVRRLERSPELAAALLDRHALVPGETLWIISQSGINALGVELAGLARARGQRVVAFTSLVHSKAVASRHASGKKLFEICDAVIDLGGQVGDAAVDLPGGAAPVGPLSTLGAVFLAHTLLVEVSRALEAQGIACAYTSVNTPQGDAKNQALEKAASARSPLLR